jgi:hypothetical protein
MILSTICTVFIVAFAIFFKEYNKKVYDSNNKTELEIKLEKVKRIKLIREFNEEIESLQIHLNNIRKYTKK